MDIYALLELYKTHERYSHLDKEAKTLVLERLISEYKNGDKTFNIFSLVIDKPKYLLKIMEENMDIPAEYAEDFMKSFLYLVNMLEKDDTASLEWDIGRMKYLHNVVESLRNKGIKDTQFLQRVNNFLTMSNNIGTSNPSSITKHNGKKIKELNISPSKLTKNDLLDALEKLDSYPEEVAERVLLSSIRRFPNDACSIQPLKYLNYMIDNKYDPDGGSRGKERIYNMLRNVPENDKQNLVDTMKSWFADSAGADPISEKIFNRYVNKTTASGSERMRSLHYADLLEEVEAFLPVMRKYYGKSIKDLVEDRTCVRYDDIWGFPYPILKQGKWVIQKSDNYQIYSSVLEYWNKLYDSLFKGRVSLKENNRISNTTLSEFVDFPHKVKLDCFPFVESGKIYKVDLYNWLDRIDRSMEDDELLMLFAFEDVERGDNVARTVIARGNVHNNPYSKLLEENSKRLLSLLDFRNGNDGKRICVGLQYLYENGENHGDNIIDKFAREMKEEYADLSSILTSRLSQLEYIKNKYK